MLMNHRWQRVLAVTALAVATTGYALAEEEAAETATTVTQAELPAAVAAAVKEFGKGGEFVKAMKGDEDGVAVYEVTVQKAGQTIEVQTTLDGVLNMREEKTDAGALPKAVVEAAEKKVAGGKVTAAEVTIRTVYELNVTDKKGKKHELLVTPGGQLIDAPEAVEAEGKEADEKGEKGEKD